MAYIDDNSGGNVTWDSLNPYIQQMFEAQATANGDGISGQALWERQHADELARSADQSANLPAPIMANNPYVPPAYTVHIQPIADPGNDSGDSGGNDGNTSDFWVEDNGERRHWVNGQIVQRIPAPGTPAPSSGAGNPQDFWVTDANGERRHWVNGKLVERVAGAAGGTTVNVNPNDALAQAQYGIGAGTFGEGEHVIVGGYDFGPVRGGLAGGVGFAYHKAAIDLANAAADRALQAARFTGKVNGQETVEQQQLKETIAQNAAERAIKQAMLTGTFTDPVSGQPVQTLELAKFKQAQEEFTKQYKLKQGELTGRVDGQDTLAKQAFDAETAAKKRSLDQVDSQLTLRKQEIDDARSAGDADRAQRATLQANELQARRNDLQKELDSRLQIAREQIIGQKELQTGELGFRREELGQRGSQFGQDLAERQRQFDVAQSGQLASGGLTLEAQRLEAERQQALSQAIADPSRLVEANTLANLYGAGRGAPSAPPSFGAPDMHTTGLPGAPAVRPLPANVAIGGAPAAFSSPASPLDPYVPLQPQVVAALSHRPAGVPAFGNPEGVAGQYRTLSSLAGTDFAKLNPRAFANLDTAAQRQIGSLARALQPGLTDEDLRRQINAQLPGRARGYPSAFAYGG